MILTKRHVACAIIALLTCATVGAVCAAKVLPFGLCLAGMGCALPLNKPGSDLRKVVGTKALDEYVIALKHGADPLVAFEKLVDQPLNKFEKDYLNYLTKLDPK